MKFKSHKNLTIFELNIELNNLQFVIFYTFAIYNEYSRFIVWVPVLDMIFSFQRESL